MVLVADMSGMSSKNWDFSEEGSKLQKDTLVRDGRRKE